MALAVAGLACALPLAAAGNGLEEGAEPVPLGSFELSAEERAWLDQHPVVRVGANMFAPVAVFAEGSNVLEGVAGSYLATAAAMTGTSFELVARTHKDHPGIMRLLGDGTVDLVAAAMADSRAFRRNEFLATSAYVEIPVVIVSRSDEPHIDDVTDLAGRRVAAIGSAVDDLRDLGIDTVQDDVQPPDGLRGVAENRYDAYILNLTTMTHFLSERPNPDIKINGQLPEPARVAMAVRAEDAVLASILTKAFAAVPSDEKDAIWRRWFRVNYEENLVASPWLWGGIGGGGLVLCLVLLQVRYLQRRERHVLGTFESLDQHLLSAHIDCKATITEVTNALCQATGFDGVELVGRSLGEVGKPAADDSATLRTIMDKLRAGATWKGEFQVHRKDGSDFWAHAVLSPRRRKGETIGFTAIWQDISDSKHFRDLSLRDELTGLFNRRHFNTEAPNLLAAAERENGLFALLALDVDCFKAYNDTYGHSAGDDVLALVGAVLQEGLRRECDLAFRIGGEEFAVAFVVAEEADALRIAESLRADLERRSIAHEKAPAGVVTASLGLVLAGPDDPRGIDQLLAAADEALYEAKNAGRNRVALAAKSA